MSFSISRRPSPALIVAAIALTFAMVGTSVAQDPVERLTKAQVKKIANKQITKRAPGLRVAHAATADKATTADNATNATTATNSNALGGRALATVLPVSTFAEDNTSQNTAGGVSVVSTTITLTTASRLNGTAAVELNGAAAAEEASCLLQIDGTAASGSFQTTFDDVAPDPNPASLTVIGSRANVAAGNHTVAMRCTTQAGVVTKENASISAVAFPNP